MTTATAINTMDLVLRVEGKVTESNFHEYKEMILAQVDQVNLDPKTDEEFAEAEETIKRFAEAEKALDEAREKALAETADIRDIFEAMTEVADRLREVRLELNRKVKAAKEERKAKAVADAVARVEDYIRDLYEKYPFIPIGTFHVVPAMISGAGKGKKKAETYIAAIERRADEICKEFDELAELCNVNNKLFDKVGNSSLFPDRKELLKKPTDELRAIIGSRIAKHQLELLAREKEEEAERRAKEQEKRAEKKKMESTVIPPPQPLEQQAMPGTTVSEEAVYQDAIENPVSHFQLYVMTVKMSGEVEAIKEIAREVDRTVSGHAEVLSISLTRMED